MSKYLNPKNDFVFKKVFGENKAICISFLNSLLPLEEDELIESIEYNSGEVLSDIAELRNTIVDVRCTDNKGRQFIVEMQLYWANTFKSRVLFSATKAYISQVKKGATFKDVQPVYTLALVDQNYTDSPECYHHYQIVESENTAERIPGLEFVFIELKKFDASSFTDKKMRNLWLRFLTEINEGAKTAPTELHQIPEIHNAIDTLERAAFTPQELEMYDKHWVYITNMQSIQDEKEERGHKRGREEGIKEGVKKGIKKGIKKGKEEGKLANQQEIARKMLAANMNMDTISHMTGLSLEDIKKLKGKN